MASVDLAGIRKRYGTLIVADGVDLAIAHEELICLLGPSGCGKTTTLRLIAGFMAPDEGTITVGGQLLSSPAATIPPERRNMSMIFQSYALWPHMTIAENVGYGLKVRRLPRAEIEQKVARILDITKLTQLRDRAPGELSGGQQQRVALARALVVEPQTLLLDEPLSNLDTNLREEMRFEIRRLHDELRYTTVYVTHDQSEAMTTADRIVVMNKGRVEQTGSPEDVYQQPNSEFVARFIGGTNILRGTADGQAVRCGPLVIECGNPMPATAGPETPVSIRPGDVEIGAIPIQGPNACAATVMRHTYLGGQRDYLLELPGGLQIRATTPLRTLAEVGSTVGIHLPREQCRGPAMLIRRRTLLAGTAALAARPAWAQQASPALVDAANREGAVVFYTSVDVAVAEKMTAAFTQQFPSIKLRVERSGAERILQRLMQEYDSKLHEADVVESSDITSFVDWKARGWLAPFISDAVAEFWPAAQRDPDGCFASVRAHLSVLAYNTKQVKPEAAPKSYADLLLPQWRMRMVKAHPAYSGTILTGTFCIVHALGWDYFEKLAKQRVMQVQSSTEPPKKVAQGERSVMADGNEYNAFFLRESGEPIEIVYPTEGTPLVPGQAGVLKDAAHPNAARLFANFLFSQPCQQLMVDVGGLRSFHPKVVLKPGRTPLSDIKLLYADPAALARETEALKQRYAQVFGV